jgi:hypothetical protein
VQPKEDKLKPVGTPQVAPARESVSARLLRSGWHRRWAMPGLVYVVLTVLCALAAYWAMFSQFQVYDDEGFFLYSLKLFVAGHPLYSSVFSEYGPFYYLLFGGLFAALGHDVTTNAGRLIQLTIWIAGTLGLGLTAHRLTGRLALGVAALATAFGLFSALQYEPMHATGLASALLTTMLIVIALAVATRPRAALSVVGALAAALLLTKINIGAYAIVAIGFATVMAGGSLVRYAGLRWLAVAAFVLIGPAVMASKLNSASFQSYAVLVVLSTLSLVFVALPRESDYVTRDESPRWLRWLIGAFAGCLVIVLAVVFALGSSPRALVNQTITLPSHQGNFATIPVTLNPEVIWWSLGAAGLAWTWRRWGRGVYSGIRPPSLWDGLLRAIAGIAILLSLGSQSLFSIAPNVLFSLAMPLAWVAALPASSDIPRPRERLVRLLIPSIAILSPLFAYPVAGTSQVAIGSIPLVLCGVVCVADGWAQLAAWNEVKAPGNPVGAVLAALGVALALGTTYQYIVQPLQTSHDQYRAEIGLNVPGATRLHLPPAQARAIDDVVALVRSRCQTLISLPGMYSFNIWTGLPTPSPLTGQQPYWLSLTYAQQFGLLRAAEASRGLCAIRNDTLALSYGQHTGPSSSSPIVDYIDRDFVPIASLAPYTVEVRRSAAGQTK